MLVKDSAGREVEIGHVSGYQDDIQIEDAWYTDESIGPEVPDDEIDFIYNEYATELYDLWYQNKVSQAEYYYEGDR